MIAKLTGYIDEIESDSIILDVNGVGYLIYIGQKFSLSWKLKQKISLYIYHYVREDSIRLYGFIDKAQREWFFLLQGVPKIGAKIAFSIISILDNEKLSQAIALQDDKIIATVPGVGKKVAERIIAELKNKELQLLAKNDWQIDNNIAMLDAIVALTNLGYSKDQSAETLSAVVKEHGSDLDCASLLRFALQKIGQKQLT